MKVFGPVVMCLLALVLAAGCASTEVTHQQLVTGKIRRPDHIWVYNFVATPTDVPADSAIAGQHAEHRTPQTAEQIKVGRELGAQIAVELVRAIREMGMLAQLGTIETKPQIDDLVIRGYLLAIDEGDATKRVTVGFGSGASELRTAVEGFQVTAQGLRKLGSGTVKAGGGKAPGGAMGVAALVATGNPAGLIIGGGFGSGASELRTAVEGFQVTAQGLRKLGSGTVKAGGGKAPGGAMGVAALVATGNPAGLIIGGGLKVYGEASGKSKIEGRAEATAKEIADHLKKRFQEQGWIQ